MTDEQREAGAWIGQHPDENTGAVRDELDEDAKRVAVTDNTPGTPGEATDSDVPPRGHREPGE